MSSPKKPVKQKSFICEDCHAAMLARHPQADDLRWHLWLKCPVCGFCLRPEDKAVDDDHKT